MSYCCCSLAGTSACDHCTNRPSEWSKPVYVINPPFTVDSTNFPPQEFVPIVRCKDCKWWEGCRMLDDDNGYCSDGERKEE